MSLLASSTLTALGGRLARSSGGTGRVRSPIDGSTGRRTASRGSSGSAMFGRHPIGGNPTRLRPEGWVRSPWSRSAFRTARGPSSVVRGSPLEDRAAVRSHDASRHTRGERYGGCRSRARRQGHARSSGCVPDGAARAPRPAPSQRRHPLHPLPRGVVARAGDDASDEPPSWRKGRSRACEAPPSPRSSDDEGEGCHRRRVRRRGSS